MFREYNVLEQQAQSCLITVTVRGMETLTHSFQNSFISIFFYFICEAKQCEIGYGDSKYASLTLAITKSNRALDPCRTVHNNRCAIYI